MFIVDPVNETRGKADKELIMVMNAFDTNFDGENEIYAVNSLPFIYMKEPIKVKQGELVRIYIANLVENDPINSIHIHGNFFYEYATGTLSNPSKYTDIIELGQGERSMIDIRFASKGRFMFHAHQTEFAEKGWSGFLRSSDYGSGKNKNTILFAIPLLLMILLLWVFFETGPIGVIKAGFPPVEKVVIEDVEFKEGRITAYVINDGPDEVKISQILVNDAYNTFSITPKNTLVHLEKARIDLSYPWVFAEPVKITLLTSSGTTFDKEIAVPFIRPKIDLESIKNFGIIGFYVGVLPILLGFLWLPFLKLYTKSGIIFYLH